MRRRPLDTRKTTRKTLKLRPLLRVTKRTPKKTPTWSQRGKGASPSNKVYYSKPKRPTPKKRSVGNKYEIISRWLLTGLAVVISRTNWNILSKNRTLSMTPGYPADEEDKTRKPYAQPHPNSLLPATWQTQVSWMSHASYVQATEAFNTARMRQENRSLTLAQPRGRARNNVVPPVLLKASASSSAEP